MTTAEDDFTGGRDLTAYVGIHRAQKVSRTNTSELSPDALLHMVLTSARIYLGFRTQ